MRATEAASYSSDDIGKASNGRIDNKRLQNWAARGLWISKVQVPEPGKAKRYSRENFCEAIIAERLRRLGFSDESARGVIQWRLRSEFTKKPTKSSGRRGGWESVLSEKFGELPELRGELRYWIIIAEETDTWGQVARGVIGCKSAEELPGAVQGLICATVFDVAAVLEEAFSRLQG